MTNTTNLFCSGPKKSGVLIFCLPAHQFLVCFYLILNKHIPGAVSSFHDTSFGNSHVGLVSILFVWWCSRFVEDGVLDAGICGKDWIVENNADVVEVTGISN